MYLLPNRIELLGWIWALSLSLFVDCMELNGQHLVKYLESSENWFRCDDESPRL